MTVWELSGVLAKTLVYIGMLAVIGGVLMLWLGRSTLVLVRLIARRYLLPMALTGLLASCLAFLLQVGSVNQSGLAGMFDPVIGGILVDAEPGAALRWRLAGFMLALLAIIPLNLPVPLWDNPRVRQFSVLLMLAASVCFAVGVASQGHAAAVGLLARSMAAAHLLAIAAWAGSFYPLYSVMLSAEVSAASALNLAERFGEVAWGILAMMICSGLVLIWQVAGGPGSLSDDNHGRLLLIKLVLVSLMMALGALHKFVLVSSLRSAVMQSDDQAISDTRRVLARSIRSETLLALLVLLLTAAMTTVTGPVR